METTPKSTFTFSSSKPRCPHRFVVNSKEPPLETPKRSVSREKVAESAVKIRPQGRDPPLASVKMETLMKKYSNKNNSKAREIMVRIQATPAIKYKSPPKVEKKTLSQNLCKISQPPPESKSSVEDSRSRSKKKIASIIALR